MKVYMELPFTNVLYDEALWSANLTDDYAEHFKEAKRYKYQKHSITPFKYPSFSTKCYRWMYTVLDPKTFVLL